MSALSGLDLFIENANPDLTVGAIAVRRFAPVCHGEARRAVM
jgi:hypothetical protein